VKTSPVKILKSILINVLIFVSAYAAAHFYQTKDLVVGAAPELSGVLLDGQFLQGLEALEKPAIIHFWATWCKICQFEHDSINRLSQDYSVISISSHSGGYSEVKEFVAANGVNYPVLNDASNSVSETWGVKAFPTSFIIDEENNIRFVEVGLTTEFGLRFRLWMTRFL